MINSPKITIYIPTKNRLQLLKRAIESVLSQTYENWELIIVNDASTDGTKDFLDQLIKENPKIKAIHHQESLGACVSRNDAIFSAQGEFITGLDDDDYFKPERLSYFLKEWGKDNVIALCTNNILIVNGKLGNITFKKEFIISQKDLLYYNYLNNQIFTKTDYLKKIGGFDSQLEIWQDYECWFRLLSLGNGKRLSMPTYCFDVSDRKDRISNRNNSKAINSFKIFSEKNKLSDREKKIMSFPLLYNGIGKVTLVFLLKMLFISRANKNYFKFLKKEVLNPQLKKINIEI